MVDWQEMLWQYLLRELQCLGREYSVQKAYTIRHINGNFVQLQVDGEDNPYLFDMNGYAGETSGEIAKNMAIDIVKNYL